MKADPSFEQERNSDAMSGASFSNPDRLGVEALGENNDKFAVTLGMSASSISSFGKYFPFKRNVKLKTLPGPLSENTLKGVAEYILSGRCNNIIVLTGAGISTSAGIPDFRSAGSGLYSTVEKLGLSTPESLFDISHFRANPRPLYAVGRILMESILNAKPTLSHYFIRLLVKKGILLRNYTQNIDGLEKAAGIDSSLVIEAHGTLSSASCIDCRRPTNVQTFYDQLKQDQICYCEYCGAYVKPDIVLFGEQLPDRFFDNVEKDCMKCDLIIVMGTSLSVHPINFVTQFVSPGIPVVLINKERVGMFCRLEDEGSIAFSDCSSYSDSKKDTEVGGIMACDDGAFEPPNSPTSHEDITELEGEDMSLTIYDREVVWLGNCDEGCAELIKYLGWGEEVEALQATTSAHSS